MHPKWTRADQRQREKDMVRKWRDALRLADRRPYVQVSPVGDFFDPNECVALGEVVVRIDNPWLLAHLPSHCYGCRCMFRTLNQRQLDNEALSLTPANKLPN